MLQIRHLEEDCRLLESEVRPAHLQLQGFAAKWYQGRSSMSQRCPGDTLGSQPLPNLAKNSNHTCTIQAAEHAAARADLEEQHGAEESRSLSLRQDLDAIKKKLVLADEQKVSTEMLQMP